MMTPVTHSTLSTNHTTVDTVVQMICQDGYITHGNVVFLCTSTGVWAPNNTGHCEGKSVPIYICQPTTMQPECF